MNTVLLCRLATSSSQRVSLAVPAQSRMGHEPNVLNAPAATIQRGSAHSPGHSSLRAPLGLSALLDSGSESNALSVPKLSTKIAQRALHLSAAAPAQLALVSTTAS